MANKQLFASAKALPAATTRNHEAAPAYAYGAKHLLAQLAATGTLQSGFYQSDEQQLALVLDAARQVDPAYVAKVAVYARMKGAMKDMPALLTAWLTVADPDLAIPVFGRVIDNGRMLRTFVQIMRSGVVGRSSLGTRPKRLVQHWLENAGSMRLMQAATGRDSSLADIVRMVHPKPADAERRAFYGWLLGRPYDIAALPPAVAGFEAWKRDRTLALPEVPFEWLTAFDLTAENWATLSGRMGWQALRMNLNTLARHGAFDVAGATEQVAARLVDPDQVRQARVMPYQLLAAVSSVDVAVPAAVKASLVEALDLSLASVPVVTGKIVVAPDVSGSMRSPVTGYRQGATTAVSCHDVASLVASAFLRRNSEARVLPFSDVVVPVSLSAHGSVAENARILASIGGGGTNVSAPLEQLNREGALVDLVVIVSDNESWVDARRRGATETMRQWARIKHRSPNAKLVCVDLQPYGTTQAQERSDIMNVGGFSDAAFETIDRFASGLAVRNWIEEVKETIV